MATEFSVRGRHVVVVGAARSGIAAAELLVRRGAMVTMSEQRSTFAEADRLHAMGVTLETGGHRQETFAQADLVVASPGVPLGQPVFDVARARGVDIVGELELAARWLKGRVIAITGTKGKSTTTTLVGRMLTEAQRKVVMGGNIGVPLSRQVDGSTTDTLHVVEASSFQLETTTTFRPWIAVWLNLADDHLDRHATVAEYAGAKARVFANQTSTDWAVLNADDAVVMDYGRLAAATQVTFSLSGEPGEGYRIEGGWVVRRSADATERLIPLAAVELTGRHMLNNVLAAAAAAHIAGATAGEMTRALAGFHGLEHVMEPVGSIGRVRFVNDSKATNVEAARSSIESFDAGVVAIIGGHFKGGDLRTLGDALRRRGRGAVAIGDSADAVVAAIAPSTAVKRAGSMRDAVAEAFEMAGPDGVVLLAPACASFDWFRDYAERGQVFKDEVARLKTRLEQG